MMYYWKWSAFIPVSIPGSIGPLGVGGGKVLLHFFPGALGVSAPYPVQTAVELFAKGKVFARQNFDGLRLNQPDGVELARIFPELADIPSSDTSGSEIGINIQLGTTQQRVDLGLSRVMVELVYPSHRVRYHAARSDDRNAVASDMPLESVEESSAPRRRIYPDPTFRSSLVEVDPYPAAVQEVVSEEPLPDDAGDAPLQSQQGGYQINSRVVAEPLMFEAAEDQPPIRFLTQYEVTSSLPISVRCL